MSDIHVFNIGKAFIGSYKKGEIVKSNYGGWWIVINIEKNSFSDTLVTLQMLYVSKYKLVRDFQLWFLDKILKPQIFKAE